MAGISIASSIKMQFKLIAFDFFFVCLSPDKILVYGKVFRWNIEKRGEGHTK